MTMKLCPMLVLMLLAISCTDAASRQMRPQSPRQAEKLGRGLFATAINDHEAFVSWRLLCTDNDRLAFDLYKYEDKGFVKLNDRPLKAGTNFTDTRYDASRPATYYVAAHGSRLPADLQAEGIEPGSFYTLPAGRSGLNYISVPLQTLPGHTPGDCSVGDLTGDGQFEIVVKQEMMPRDNSHSGLTGQTKLEAYRLDGMLLWRIDLGRNIREGAHYTQFMVYDLDGDGRAEVACKTADGTIDGQGNIIGDATADWRELKPPYIGHILSGPEYLTVFDGASGKALATTAYNPPRHPDKLRPTTEELQAIWGDGKGNRADRYLACVAYLDGQHPSLVMCRGYYTRNVLAAWNYRDGQLTPVWTFDSDDPDHPENYIYRGNGNHNLSVADVDGDGCDEIIYGNMVVDHDGRGLYCTRIGHADAMHVSDLDPDRPGLEVFNSQEPVGPYGMNFRHAGTGEIYWNVPTDSVAVSYERKVQGPGRVAAFDIDPRYRGSECWVLGGGIYGLYNCRGELISERTPRSCNFGIWWDGDLQRELLDRNQIFKYNWQTEQLEEIFRAEDCTSNNGTKATPALSGDLWGDWREEVIFRTRDNQELRIYSTTTASPYRLVTLLQDPVYRLGLVWQNVAYNIPPHLSYYIGE